MTVIQTNVPTEELVAAGCDPTSSVEVIAISTITSNNVSVTEIVAKIQTDIVRITADSRRSPGDRPDPRVGELLSIARAYRQLAKKVDVRATGLVEHNAHIASIRPQQRERNAKRERQIMRVANHNSDVQREILKQVRDTERSWTAREVPLQRQD